MEEKKDHFLGVVIILGVIVTMIGVATLRDTYEDTSGAAMAKTFSKSLPYVWIDKLEYSPGEDILIKWNVPKEYRSSIREVHLVNEQSGAYFILAKDYRSLGEGDVLAKIPSYNMQGTWHVRVTTYPYTSTSPVWESKSFSISG